MFKYFPTITATALISLIIGFTWGCLANTEYHDEN